MSRLLVAQRALTVPGWAKDALWRSARAVPSLDLRFADNKSLVDAVTGASLITFTRASSGTFVDSAGVLRTAVTNLLLQSEDFETTWFLTSATLSANAIAAPNGTLTAEQLVEAATTANHEAGQTFASPVANATYTLSCYLKAATSTTCGIRFSNGLNGTGIICSVDLTAQTVTVTAGTGTATIANVGSGWFRVSLTATASGTPASTTVSIFRSIGTAGSIANSIYLWGAQLEQSATVGEYIPTTSAINSAPRFDHNPTTGESLGLLVEEQRTNLLANSEDTAARWPTKALVTVSANTTDAPNGTVTADSCVETAALGDHYLQLAITQAANTTLSYSVFLKVLGSNRDVSLTMFANSFTDNSSAQFLLSTATVASVTKSGTGALPTASIQRFANGWLRLSISGQPTTAAVTDLFLRIQLINASTTYTGDGTSGLFIWGAQLEAGATPTSYIPTTTAAATRSADVASITGTAFSGWYRQDEGTLFAEFGPYGNGGSTKNAGIFQIGSGSAANRIGLFGGGTISPVFIVDTSSVNQVYISTSIISPSATSKISAAYKINDFARAVNGSNLGTDSNGSVPTVSQMLIGTGSAGVSELNGTIRRLVYWGQRLPNNVLQAITQ